MHELWQIYTDGTLRQVNWMVVAKVVEPLIVGGVILYCIYRMIVAGIDQAKEEATRVAIEKFEALNQEQIEKIDSCGKSISKLNGQVRDNERFQKALVELIKDVESPEKRRAIAEALDADWISGLDYKALGVPDDIIKMGNEINIDRMIEYRRKKL